MIEFKRPDGKLCPGYLATPKEDAGMPGFVVIQEWWGVNDQIKRTADRLAEAGYRALVPDLYRGKVASAADEANHLMGSLNFPDAAGQDIRGAVQYLKQSSPKVTVGGFCLGGALTLLCAAHVPRWTPAHASMAFRQPKVSILRASRFRSSATLPTTTIGARQRRPMNWKLR
jgi:carboxymethylenebutenolidase